MRFVLLIQTFLIFVIYNCNLYLYDIMLRSSYFMDSIYVSHSWNNNDITQKMSLLGKCLQTKRFRILHMYNLISSGYQQ